MTTTTERRPTPVHAPADPRHGTTCCGSPPPAASTTASPPWSGACCTTPSRCSPTSSTRSSASAATAGWRPPTSPCSPTGCAPSASRASPSTWPTATSPPPTRSLRPRRHPRSRQYTRNMVTGASTAELALILVDARHGVVEQTRRHLAVTGLLGVRHVALAVNKMDLVDWDETAFDDDRGRVRRAVARASASRTWWRCRSRRCTATTSSTARSAATGTPARPSSSTSRPCRSAPTPPPSPLRLPVQYVIRPQTRRAPRLPRVCRAARLGRGAPGRRGRRPALGPHARRWPASTAPTPPAGARARRRLRAPVGGPAPDRRHRHLPRRPHRRGRCPRTADPRDHGHRGGPVRPNAARPRPASSCASAPAPSGPWWPTSSTSSTSRPCSACRRQRAWPSTRSDD